MTYRCDLCWCEYESLGEAIRCCGDQFDTDGPPLVADGSGEQTTCTNMNCHGEAEYAYWMPDFGHFSKARNPEHDLLDDGDLAPYVCESCRDYMVSGPHWDEERFIRPEEKLVTDGGWPSGDPCPECGDLMDVGAVGNPGETITWQECEDCDIGWGPWTGYVDTSDGTTEGTPHAGGGSA